ncbi:MAG TPA: membrane protein insertase YidC [Deltaproteobacteria bacterium]|nr:membrane protein insertase YidC [Deltaproteobacteria bacterium]
MDKRTLLAIVLSLAVLFLYQIFFVKPPEQQLEPVAEEGEMQILKEEVMKPLSPGEIAKAKKTAVMRNIAEKEITVETSLYTAVFSTKGAGLKSFKLKNYREECVNCPNDIFPVVKNFITGSQKDLQPKSGEPVELVSVKEGMPYPLAITFPDSSINIPEDSMFRADVGSLDLTGGNEEKRLVFSGIYDGVIKVEKIYTFNPDNYAIELDVKMYNLTGALLIQTPRLNWHQYEDPANSYSRYDKQGPLVSVANSIKRQEVKKLDSDKMFGPNVLWGGFETKYFVASFIPENPSLTSSIMSRDSRNMVTVGIWGQKEIIPGGQSAVVGYSLYLGPKQYDLLKSLNVGLERAIDFGIFKWLAVPFLLFLKFLHGFVPNYGLAIILLTILIKLVFWPLGNMSYKSMREMQKLQPKINELKQKYKKDQSKIGQETMALYRAHKVNPLSGCLPLLIQLPVFIGLFNALLYAIELRHSPFFFWIQDLSAKDPYYITPILMGISQFIQQKMTPTMGDPMMAKMMMFMPVVLTIFFLNFPSGLVIYWLFNNILSIGQQMYINKKLAN